MKKLRLGNLELDTPFFQAPLSGYSDYAMRSMARRFGAPLTFNGLILAKSVTHPKVLALQINRPVADECPVGAQIVGEDPAIMVTAAKQLESVGYHILDLNFACPAPKVVRRKRGGYMLNTPRLVIEIYRRVRDAIKCPLTVKLRIKFDENDGTDENFWQICETLSSDGVDALVIHGRSTVQKYFGKADWETIAAVKKAFPNTTIVGSGDVFDPALCVQRLRETGIDGLLVARGAIGNPWIFPQLRAAFNGEPPLPHPTLTEQADTIKEHFALLRQLYKGQKAVHFFRKFMANYCRLHPQRKKVQHDLMAVDDNDELLAKLKDWYTES